MEKQKHSNEYADSDLSSGIKELILHNDDHNSFDFVIESLVKICNHTDEQAYQCTLVAHYKGKCAVKTGSLDELTIMHKGLTDKGLYSTIE